MFTFQSTIGKLERENTLQCSRDAILRLAREGAWLGGIVPFEVPDLEDAAPRTAKTPLAPSGLMLTARTQNVLFVWEAREAASERLKKSPKLQLKEVIAQLQTRGLPISLASVSRSRAELKRTSATPA